MKNSKNSDIGNIRKSEGLWTVKQFAEYLDVSTSYLYKNKEKFPFVRINWNIKFIPSAVKKHVNRKQRIPTTKN